MKTMDYTKLENGWQNIDFNDMLPFEVYINRYKEIPPKIYFDVDNISFRYILTIKIILNEHLDILCVKNYISEE